MSTLASKDFVLTEEQTAALKWHANKEAKETLNKNPLGNVNQELLQKRLSDKTFNDVMNDIINLDPSKREAKLSGIVDRYLVDKTKQTTHLVTPRDRTKSFHSGKSSETAAPAGRSVSHDGSSAIDADLASLNITEQGGFASQHSPGATSPENVKDKSVKIMMG